MRVVIAGSAGLIGTSLVAALRQAEHEVVRLVRRAPEAPDERHWDPQRGQLDDSALEGVDAVVNLCGAGLGDKRWNPQRKRELVESRVQPTSVLAEAVVERGVPTLLNGSAVGFYGHTGDRQVTEDAEQGGGFLADLCRRWESATTPAVMSGTRVALLRSGVVLAPSGGMLGPLKPLFKLMLGGRIGDGAQYVPWISLDDEIGAIRFVLEHPEISGPVNLTGPAPVTNAEFTREIARALGRPAPWVVPGFAVRAALGEFADEAVLIGQRATPAVLREHGFTFQHETVEAAMASALAA